MPLRYLSAVRLSLLFFVLAALLPAGREFAVGNGERVVNNELIVRMRPGFSAHSLAGVLPAGARTKAFRGAALNGAYLVTLPGPAAVKQTARRLASAPGVEYVEPNRLRVNRIAAPNDPLYATQWALAKIQAFDSWRVAPGRYLSGSTARRRPRVALLDTGVDCTHPDFINQSATSFDSDTGGQVNVALSRTVTGATATCAVTDEHGHGTRVAGALAAAANNSQGIAGAAYGAELVVYKVLGAAGTGSDSVIAQAIQDAADSGASVILMAFSSPGYSQTVQEAITYAWRRNVLVVAAAGNTGSASFEFPASAHHVLTVTATDQNDARVGTASFGPAIGIAAPGLGVLTTSRGGGYGSVTGTSIAAPLVAGAAAMVASSQPGVLADAVAQRLQQSADSSNPLGGWSAQNGYGRLNMRKAISGSLRSATAGSVRVQVVDEFEIPVPSAVVSSGSRIVTADAAGMARFENLPAGLNSIAANSPGYPSRTMVVNVAPGAGRMKHGGEQQERL